MVWIGRDDPNYQRYLARMDAAIDRGVAFGLLSSLVALPLSVILIGVVFSSRSTGLINVVTGALFLYGVSALNTASGIVARRVEGSVLRLVFSFDRRLQFGHALFTKGLRVSIHRLFG